MVVFCLASPEKNTTNFWALVRYERVKMTSSH